MKTATRVAALFGLCALPNVSRTVTSQVMTLRYFEMDPDQEFENPEEIAEFMINDEPCSAKLTMELESFTVYKSMLTQLQGAVERFIDDMYASYEASGSGSSSGSDPTGGDDMNDNNTAWSNYTSWSNYTISSNYTGGSNSTSSSNNSDHNTYGSDTDDDMTIVLDSNYTEFDECMDGEMVTCVDDVLTLEQFDSDSCSGTAINTTTWSHDTCYLEAVSVGCSSASTGYTSTVEDLEVIATHYSEDTCTTMTTTEEIDFDTMKGYVNITVTNALEELDGSSSGSSTSTNVAAATIVPALNLGLQAMTVDGSCNEDDTYMTGGYMQAVCVSETFKAAVYQDSTCSGEPLALVAMPGCLDTDVEGDYVMVACAGDDISAATHVFLTNTPAAFILGTSAALVWGVFGYIIDGFF